MLELIWVALVLFSPAGIANAMPVFANKIPVINKWKTPLDFGHSWRGKRIFGANKSWRGLISGVLAAVLVGVFVANPILAATTSHERMPVGLMIMLGLGALIGDAVESFFKRQLNRPPGTSWFPFDQTDYIIGGLLFALPFQALDVPTAGTILILYFVLHLVFSYVGYLLGLKEKPI